MFSRRQNRSTDAELLLNADDETVDQRIGRDRRRFLLFVGFDFGLTCILWIIFTVSKGSDWRIDFYNQCNFHDPKFFSLSFFDVVLVSLGRLIWLIIWYGIVCLNHWWPVALSTALTTGFLVTKIVCFFLESSNVSQGNPLSYAIPICSFVIAWIELYLLDIKVLPTEKRAREVVAVNGAQDGTETNRGRRRHGAPGYISDYRTAAEVSSDSDEGIEHSTESRSRRRNKSSGGEAEYRPYGNYEYIQVAQEAMKFGKTLIGQVDTWSKKHSSPLIRTTSTKDYGRILYLKTEFPVSVEVLFNILYKDSENVPKWNKLVLETKTVLRVNEHVDVTYSISAPAMRNYVASRDFLDVRYYEQHGRTYHIASISVRSDLRPPQAGSKLVRKFKIYDMKWQNLSLASCTVAAEKYGGHIAVANNFEENGAKRTQFTILFYTSFGQLLNKVQWRNGDLICMDWSTDTEELICVQNDGRTFVYSFFGVEKEDRRFSMGQEAQEMKLINCKLFDSYSGSSGVCVLTKMNRFYVVNNVEEPKVWRTPEIHGSSKSNLPSCWTVLSKDRVTRVICAIGYEIYSLEQGKLSEPMVPSFDTPVKQYVAIAVSPDKTKLAILTDSGLVQITSSDLQHSFCECDSGTKGNPRNFLWCGNEAAGLYDSNNNLQLISLNGVSAHFPVDQNAYLLEEIDGIRIFDGFCQEFLEKVTNACVETLSVSSLAPSGTLLEAYKEFKKKGYKAYEFVRMIGNMGDAVKTCIEAALNEYDTENQKILLLAASLGQAFVHDADSDALAQAGRVLKVLNNVRDKLTGIPITYSQFQTLSSASLIDRLIYRGQWPMALECSRHMRFTAESGVYKILAYWATKKMDPSNTPKQSDSAVAERIGQKFAEYPGVSFADAAEKATEFGRKELATLLLENESNLERQVYMLMKLGRNEKALSKACGSGEPELSVSWFLSSGTTEPQTVCYVILHLRKMLDKKSDLDLILRNFPAAFSLYKIYCRHENPQHLKSLLKQTDDFINQGLFLLKEADDDALIFDAREKIDLLKEAENCFRQGKDEFSAHQLNDECKLLKYQAELEEKLGQSLLGTSLRETFMKCVELQDNNRSQYIKKEFQVSDKQFWWWKIEALAKSSQWNELESFSKLKKSPIGYLPFIDVSMKYNQINEAKKYLSKIPPEEKVKAYIKMKLFGDAATLAFQQRDENALNRILAQCGSQNRNVCERINQLKQELSSSKQK